jgi:hypothetical protein
MPPPKNRHFEPVELREERLQEKSPAVLAGQYKIRMTVKQNYPVQD